MIGLLMKVVRSGDLISYCAEEGVRILGEGKFLTSDSFPGNERSKYCLVSKVSICLITCLYSQCPICLSLQGRFRLGVAPCPVGLHWLNDYGNLYMN